MTANNIMELGLHYINPFAPKFNSHLLIIAKAIGDWESLDLSTQSELLKIYNSLLEFSNESRVSTFAEGPEETKIKFGAKYQQLMKSITQKPIYIESLKAWASDDSWIIEKELKSKFDMEVRTDMAITDDTYERDIQYLLNMPGIDDYDKKYMVARLDLLRHVNKLIDKAEFKNGESQVS